ncbi:MAG: methyl-accepting chemotaxis protein [Lachnospiraceae bacterium]|nr:methyl-accepting chemotaxis protein [Lachnospiraceae bacterium]
MEVKIKKQLDVRQYVIRLSLLMILIVAFNTCVIGIVELTNNINNDYQAIARNSAMHVITTVEGVLGEGLDWSYDSATGTLYYGDTKIDDTSFKLAQNNDNKVSHTLFWGDTRVVTDLTDANGRIDTVIGTKCDPAIYEHVKKEGVYTDNNVRINGVAYTVCYYGIFNGSELVGMSFCGVVQTRANLILYRAYTVYLLIEFIMLAIILPVTKHVLDKKLKTANDQLTDCENELLATEQNVKETSDIVIVASNEINAAATEVARTTAHQASCTQEAMAGIEEFGNSVDVIIDNLGHSMEQSKAMKRDLFKTQESITAFKESTEIGSAKIEEVQSGLETNRLEIENISKAIEDIDSVSFQITLLALNAQVEAARAGEYGLGFGVVANSIKDLSSKTAESAEVIHAAVEKALGCANGSLELASDLVSFNNDNAKKLQSAIQSFDELSRSIDSVNDNLSDITAEARDTIVVKQQMTEVIQSLAAASEESSSMSEEMQASVIDINSQITDLGQKISALTNVQNILSDVKNYFLAPKVKKEKKTKQ